MDDLLNRKYYGWENKCTWLVHLHLSNEQALFLEIAQLVACEPNDGPAGRLLEMWVRLSITNWMNRFPGRNRSYDAYIGLLVWDLLGSSLASTEWTDLVTVLTGGEANSNVFTMTLTRCIQQSQLLHTHIEVVLRDASSVHAAVDALKAWFDALLADWVDKMALGRRVDPQTAQVFSG
ncbi:MAG TPA: hypothetical protein VF844_11985, partial [Ktedonobacteraceae bacterium]